MTGQTWDAGRYAANGRFVATMAGAVVDLLEARAGERILDLGCGDGTLTERIAATGARMVGVDASEAMVLAGRARGLEVVHGSALDMAFAEEFDAVFSNAALHWIPCAEQGRALGRVVRALKAGGRFVAEMGGQGNVAAIRTALRAVLGPMGVDAEAEAASCFPSVGEQRSRLQTVGFAVRGIEVIPRPTPLPGGADGMRMWLETFRNGVLDRLPTEERARVVDEVVQLLRPVLADGNGEWTADYVRLRFVAEKG